MNVGDKVVCVNDRKTPQVNSALFPNWVKEGETYTIRKVEGSTRNEVRVLLEEISNPPAYFPVVMGNVEPGFAQSRFVDWTEYIMGNVASQEAEVEQEKTEKV